MMVFTEVRGEQIRGERSQAKARPSEKPATTDGSVRRCRDNSEQDLGCCKGGKTLQGTKGSRGSSGRWGTCGNDNSRYQTDGVALIGLPGSVRAWLPGGRGASPASSASTAPGRPRRCASTVQAS